jgi:hypothetical protein
VIRDRPVVSAWRLFKHLSLLPLPAALGRLLQPSASPYYYYFSFKRKYFIREREKEREREAEVRQSAEVAEGCRRRGGALKLPNVAEGEAER